MSTTSTTASVGETHPDPKLYVGGLPNSVMRDELLHYFSHFGAVADCIVMTDKETGTRRSPRTVARIRIRHLR